MFCPKCSQQQISDETRFCSRCGFELNVVKALLASDDAPQSVEIQKPDRSLRPRDMTIGAGIMFFFAFIVAVITVDMPPSHSSRIV
ncbi:MAG: zinc ribbon domain-containing protein, partial [Pyrinomonadaceae bacterium]